MGEFLVAVGIGLAILVLVAAVGAVNRMTPEQWNYAEPLCVNNGGTKRVTVIGRVYYAECADGIEIKRIKY